MQYGHVERATHNNTSWQSAQHEVVGHKWAHLGDYSRGLAVLNDCKYGYSCTGSALRLSLLRAPKNPDATADMGDHVFSYAVLGHGGSFQDAGVVSKAASFNSPLVVADLPPGPLIPFSGPAPGFTLEWLDGGFSSGGGAGGSGGGSLCPVVLDAVKKAEDSDSAILRLYESFGGSARVRLGSRHRVLAAYECSLLEDRLVELGVGSDGKSVEFELSPFSVFTLQLVFAE